MTEKIIFFLLVALYLLMAAFAALFLDLLDYCLKPAYAETAIKHNPATFICDFAEYNNFCRLIPMGSALVLNVNWGIEKIG